MLAEKAVPYCEDLATVQAQCNAFVLTQYSLAPVVLAVQNSQCGEIGVLGSESALQSKFLLENSHDPKIEPYLLRLFPQANFESANHARAVAECDPGRLVLQQDFGRGVKLYARETR